MTARYNAPGEILPYTDRKLAEGNEFQPWPIEDTVRAQWLFAGGFNAHREWCEPHSIDEIAAAMQRPHDEVRRVVSPDVAKETKRQEMASVGFEHLKRGW